MGAKLVAGSANGKGSGSAKARAIQSAARRLSGGRRGVVLIGMTDAVRLPDPLKALDALPAGCALVWRAYGTGADATEFQRLAVRARAKNCLLLVAGEPKRARRPGAGGLHLPERLLGRFHGNGFGAVTAAAHSEAAIHRAARAGADAVLISPVLPTQSHEGAPSLGPVRLAHLARIARALGLAPYALGGISEAHQVRRLAGTSIDGVAGIGFLLD